MNINIELNIKDIKYIDDETEDIFIKKNILVEPLHATIQDILLYFYNEQDQITAPLLDKVQEIIFNKSIWIDSYIRNKRLNLPKEDLFIILRDYVICATVLDLSRILTVSNAQSSTVKKSLGDFSVERSTKVSSADVSNIKKDADNCIKEIIKAIDELAADLVNGFVKGEINPSNRNSWRLWHSPNFISRVPIAANKIQIRKDFYKTGEGPQE